MPEPDGRPRRHDRPGAAEPTGPRTAGADGAGDRPAAEPPSGRDRLRAALRRPSRGQVVVGVLLAVLGLRRDHPGAHQHSRQHLRRLPRAGPRRRPRRPGRHAQRAQAEIDRLEAPRPTCSRDTERRRGRAGAGPAAGADSSASWPARCRSPARASGSPSTEGAAPVDVDTVLDTVEELRAAGAEAMQINGKVRRGGPERRSRTPPAGSSSTARLLKPPYVIDVIGDPHTLAGAHVVPRRARSSSSRTTAATVEVEEHDSLDITSVATAEPSLAYAEPRPAE